MQPDQKVERVLELYALLLFDYVMFGREKEGITCSFKIPSFSMETQIQLSKIEVKKMEPTATCVQDAHEILKVIVRPEIEQWLLGELKNTSEVVAIRISPEVVAAFISLVEHDIVAWSNSNDTPEFYRFISEKIGI